MLALFHSNEFEIDGVKYPLKIVGSTEKPWFKADDVCKALGYANTHQALIRHITNPTYKTSMNSLLDRCCAAVHPSFRRDREGQQPYISEPGVYALIFGSKLPSADKFRTWVFNDVLPSIRKDGQYKLTRELEDAKKEVEDAKQAAEDAKQAVEDAKKEVEEANKEKETLKSELDRESKMALHLKQMILNEKARTPDQIIYIATTKQYAANNRFKIGGCKSRAHLRNRLNQYNSGRPVGDKMYFAAIFECVDYIQTESRIKSILGLHREVSDAEVYNLHYTALQHWVEFLVERYNEEVSIHRNKLNELLNQTLTSPPVIPEPLILNGVEFRLIKNGQIQPKIMIDLDEMTLEERQEWMLNVIEKTYPEKSVIERKELFEKLIQEHGAKFNKTKMWPVVKTLTNCRGFKFVY